MKFPSRETQMMEVRCMEAVVGIGGGDLGMEWEFVW